MENKIRSGWVGWIVWLAYSFWLWYISGFSTTDIICSVLLFAILIIVPLSLPLIQRNDRYFNLATTILMPSGIFAACSFLYDQGWFAVILAIPWFFVTILFALSGLVSLSGEKKTNRASDWMTTAALIYILVGGIWLIIERSGYDILGFSSTIILLTAMHFHYAAFIAPLIVASMGKLSNQEVLLKWIAVGIILSPILVAIGITGSDVIEVISVCLFFITLIVYAVVSFIRWIPSINEKGLASWLYISSASIIVAMLAALLYQTAGLFSIDQMVLIHGVLNAFGFAFCGVIGTRLLIKEKVVDQKMNTKKDVGH